MKKAYTQQVLQNYFDPTDHRSRENSTSLEAQLLNLAANPMEDLDMRITRENSQALQTVPVNIDNRGVYFAGQVPSHLITSATQTSLSNVTGKSGSVIRTLLPYDDRLPVPTRIGVGAPVALANPLLFTLIGSGDDRTLGFTVQYATLGDFPLPNRLTLWIDQVGLDSVFVTLTITGEVAPKPAWFAERTKTTEVLIINGEGFAQTRNRWDSIDKIAVRGLPIGVRLRGYSMPFGLPAAPDLARPFTTPEDRDVLFQRYWQISNSEQLLKEMYRAGGFTGLETYRSYLLANSMIDLAVEPNTYGLFTVSQDKLYYFDRREDLPSLFGTGLFVEPMFGLQVGPDLTKSGPIRYVNLSGIPYANSANIFNYRYVFTTSSSIGSGYSSILPDGSIGPVDRGWRGGAPQAIAFPLQSTGDYVFRLEMQDASGNTTYDVVPWNNGAASPLASLDISSLVDVVKGIAFDSYGTLWIWNGSHAIPLTLHYDAYVLDPSTGYIFLTDQYDSLQVS